MGTDRGKIFENFFEESCNYAVQLLCKLSLILNISYTQGFCDIGTCFDSFAFMGFSYS